MKTTIIFTIYYIILLGYLLTGILLKNWKGIAYAVLLGILGIFISIYLRDRPEGSYDGYRIKDRRI
jgi:uncharacterized oligopeptide transporter (OPT) family protein